MLWIVLGGLLILAGIVMLILGNMWGLALIFGGIIAVFFCYSSMMRGKGMDPDQGTVNGINGQGKQQSEAVSVSQNVIGEQPADIWDQMEQKKEQ